MKFTYYQSKQDDCRCTVTQIQEIRNDTPILEIHTCTESTVRTTETAVTYPSIRE